MSLCLSVCLSCCLCAADITVKPGTHWQQSWTYAATVDCVELNFVASVNRALHALRNCSVWNWTLDINWLYMCLSVCLSLCMSLCPYVCLSYCLSAADITVGVIKKLLCMKLDIGHQLAVCVSLSTCPSVRLSVCLSVHPSISLSVYCLWLWHSWEM